MKRLLLLSSLAILLLTSCKKDQEGDLVIHFVPYYDGQPLHTFVTKTSPSGDPIQFTHMSLLVSDLMLTAGSNEESLRDVELVDMSFDNQAAAENGYIIQIKDLPAKSYDGISFGVGIPADLNAKTPSDFTSSSPLSKTGYYWQAWSSYIFMKMEGRIDVDGSGNFNTGFAYHTGTDPLYRILEANVPVTITDGGQTELHIAIDYFDMLNGIDIRNNPQNHNPADSVQIAAIVNNLQTAVTLFQ